jgi:hypothetical protein
VPELSFALTGAAPLRFAAAPEITLALRITNARTDEEIHSILLRCQVRIEPGRRRYSAPEERALVELFGARAEWSRSQRPLHWTQAMLFVPAFRGAVEVELPLPCGYDQTVTAVRLLDVLDGGELPISVLFSGTVFHAGSDGLQVAQLPWSAEARYALPVAVWRALIDDYYPNAVFLPLPKELLARLHSERSRRRLLTLEQTVAQLLDEERR